LSEYAATFLPKTIYRSATVVHDDQRGKFMFVGRPGRLYFIYGARLIAQALN